MAKAHKRRETRKYQRESSPKLHPRSLARSIGIPKAGKAWREEVAKLPRIGQMYLHPENHRPKEVRGN